MSEPVITEAPVAPKQEPVLPNPVIPPDMDFSKSAFNDALAAAKGEEPEKPESPEPVKDEPPIKVEKESTDKSTDKPTESSETKSLIPEELISGEKEQAKIDDALAEIDAMSLPKSAKQPKVESFNALKEKSKQLLEAKIARIAELESKQSDATSKAEIEAAQERVKQAEEKAREYESTIERLAFYESPKFKQFGADEEAQLASAKTYFAGTDINPEIIEVAARSAGPNRIRILKEAGLDSDTISAVAPYLASFDTIQRNKAAALEGWKTDSAKYAEQQKAQAEAETAQRKSQEENVWNTELTKARNTVAPLRKFEKNDAWNTRADQLASRAQQIFSGEGTTLNEMADVIAKGVAYDALEEVRLDLTNQLKLLRQENSKLKAAKPDGGTSSGDNGAKLTDTMTPDERAKASFNAELQKARA